MPGTTLWYKSWSGNSTTTAVAAGGSVGTAPIVGDPGNALGPPTDVVGGIWRILGTGTTLGQTGRLTYIGTPTDYDYDNIGNVLKFPVTTGQLVSVQTCGTSGDRIAPVIRMLATGADSGSMNTAGTNVQGVTVIFTGAKQVSVKWYGPASVRGSVTSAVLTGASYGTACTMRATVRYPTAAEKTTYSISDARLIVEVNVANGNSTTWTDTFLATTIPVGAIPASGGVQIIYRQTIALYFQIEEYAAFTAGAVYIDSGTGKPAISVENTSGGTVNATLAKYDSLASGASGTSAGTATRTGDGSLVFSDFTAPTDSELHFYAATITDVAPNITQTHTAYLSSYSGGSIAGVLQPLSFPVQSVPTITQLTSDPGYSNVVLMCDSRGGSASLTSKLATLFGRSVTFINASHGGTGWADWQSDAAATGNGQSVLSGQSSYNNLVGAKRAADAAGGTTAFLVSLGTNDFNDTSGSRSWRLLVVKAIKYLTDNGFHVYMMQDDQRIYTNTSQEAMLARSEFLCTVPKRFGGTISGASDDRLQKYWLNNVSTISTDGIHWTSYADRDTHLVYSLGQMIADRQKLASTGSNGGSRIPTPHRSRT